MYAYIRRGVGKGALRCRGVVAQPAGVFGRTTSSEGFYSIFFPPWLREGNMTLGAGRRGAHKVTVTHFPAVNPLTRVLGHPFYF